MITDYKIVFEPRYGYFIYDGGGMHVGIASSFWWAKFTVWRVRRSVRLCEKYNSRGNK